jgi:hypothetical protein
VKVNGFEKIRLGKEKEEEGHDESDRRKTT